MSISIYKNNSANFLSSIKLSTTYEDSKKENTKDDSAFCRILKDVTGSASKDPFPLMKLDTLSKAERESLLQRFEITMNVHLLSMMSDKPERDSLEWLPNFSFSYSMPGQDIKMSKYTREQQIGDTSSNNHQFDTFISKASHTYQVDAALIRSVIKVESNFNPSSTSSKGAMGLMQLMPETAKELGVHDAYNPEQNILAGTRYLKGLLTHFHGNVPLALASYNWGKGNVERYPEKMPLETRNYIVKVITYLNGKG